MFNHLSSPKTFFLSAAHHELFWMWDDNISINCSNWRHAELREESLSETECLQQYDAGVITWENKEKSVIGWLYGPPPPLK